MKLAEPKTKLMAQALGRLVGDATALILIPSRTTEYDQVVRSANNIPVAKTIMAGYINVRDLLGYDKLVLPLEALDVLTEHLG
jgi:large subunit ribosomal protein L4